MLLLVICDETVFFCPTFLVLNTLTLPLNLEEATLFESKWRKASTLTLWLSKPIQDTFRFHASPFRNISAHWQIDIRLHLGLINKPFSLRFSS